MTPEAFARRRNLTMEIAAVPDSVRRITLLVEKDGDLLAFDGQEHDVWNVRHPVVLTDLQGEWPVWTTGHMIVRDITDV